jgi:hypothetical protein
MNKYTRKTLAYAWVGVVLAAVLGVVLAALTFTFGWWGPVGFVAAVVFILVSTWALETVVE